MKNGLKVKNNSNKKLKTMIIKWKVNMKIFINKIFS